MSYRMNPLLFFALFFIVSTKASLYCAEATDIVTASTAQSSIASGPLCYNFRELAITLCSLAFSPDNKMLATGSESGYVSVWNAETMELLLTFKAHEYSVCSLAFNAKGKILLTGSWDTTAKLWKLKNDTLLLILKGHTSSVSSAVWGPDEETIITGSWDGTVRLWDRKTGTSLKTLEKAENISGLHPEITSVEISADGKTVLTTSWDRTACLWNLSTGELLKVLQEKETNTISDAAFNKDSSKVITRLTNGENHLWDVETKNLQFVLEQPIGGLLSTAFSSTGDLFIIQLIDGVVDFATLSPTDLLIPTQASEAANTLKGSPQAYNEGIGSEETELEKKNEASDASTLPAQELLLPAQGTEDTLETVLKASPQSNSEEIGSEEAESTLIKLALLRCPEEVTFLHYSPRHNLVITAVKDGTIHLWDSTTGRTLAELEGPETLSAVTISHDGKILVAKPAIGDFTLWFRFEDTYEEKNYKGLFGSSLEVDFPQKEEPFAQWNQGVDLQDGSQRRCCLQ